MLASAALHASGRFQLALLAAGAALVLIAATTTGPLAVARLVPRPVHRVLDYLLVAAIALSPLAGGPLDASTVIVAEAAALVMLRASVSTRYNDSPRATTTAPGAGVPDVGAPVRSAPGGGRWETADRVLRESAHVLGRAVGRTRRDQAG